VISYVVYPCGALGHEFSVVHFAFVLGHIST
jgi:hypothetical protein